MIREVNIYNFYYTQEIEKKEEEKRRMNEMREIVSKK